MKIIVLYSKLSWLQKKHVVSSIVLSTVFIKIFPNETIKVSYGVTDYIF